MPSPMPVFIAAITARSAFSARSVTNDRSELRSRASTRCASRTRHPIALRTSSSVCRPGEWPSTRASRWCAANTDWRSSRCRIACHAIFSAEENRRQRNRAPRAADDRNLAEFPGPGRPDRPQHRVQRLRLALPRRKRRNLRRRPVVVPALLVHIGFHLFPAGREGLLDPPVIARDLEAPHAPRHRRQDRVALPDQAPRQLVPVIGPDQDSRSGAARSARCSSIGPRRPGVMFATTAWVCSCGSRLRLAMCRNSAAAMPRPFTRGRRPVAGS